MLQMRFHLAIAFAVLVVIFPTFVTAQSTARNSSPAPKNSAPWVSEVSSSRLSRLRHGINLSHWFAQSANNDYSKTHLDSYTTAQDIAVIKSMGFDHVRFTVEPAPLFNWADPSTLKTEYLRYLDSALDMILAQGLAVIVDIHPSDDFKVKLNTDDRHVENFTRFWRALAQHLSTRDPERTFLEVLNEPMVEDGYRWFGIQAKVIAAMRAVAPEHTIIASGHRWSGLYELLAMEPYSDRNIVYNFHFYEPFAFTHQGANWAGPNLQFYKNVPYPSSPEAVTKMLDTVVDDPARFNLLRYGEERWNAARLDADMSVAAAWAEKHHVHVTCNEFGAYRRFATAADRAAWILDIRMALEKHGIGWTMWDYAGGFGVVNKENGKATPDAETVKALGLNP
jgi:endoglucanase